MAIIYSYPKNTNILGTDVLIGTSTIVQNGKRKNQTKSFTMLDISNYVSDNLTLDIPTLQQVTEVGNTTEFPIIIEALGFFEGLSVSSLRTAISASAYDIGVNAWSNTIGVQANGGYAGIVAGGDFVGIDAYGGNVAGTFNIPPSNNNNIAEFKKNGVKQAYITHNGTIVSNKLLVNTTVDNGVDDIQVIGSILATTIKKSGGTSSQFLKADGSIDSNMYALSSDLVGKYVTEASQTGIVFFNNPRANYGNIGVDAVDFSYSGNPSSVMGATGESSFNTGINTTSSGYNSTTFGFDNTTSAIGGFTTGFNSQNAGYTNFVTGIGHDVTGMNTTVVGQASNVIAESTASFNVATAPVFVVGNGTITDADPDYTVASRSDAFIVRKSGEVNMPKYGDGAITGTATYALQVDANGKIVEGALSGATPTLQQVTNMGSTTTNNITANGFIKSGGTSSQFLKANGTVDSTTYVKVLLNDFPDTAVTGTITETLLSTFTIPAFTFPTTCMPTFLIRMSKSGDVGASTVRLRFSTTNNPATATTLATYIIPATIDSAIIGRNPIIKAGNIRIGVPTSTFLSEASQATSTESVIPFDVTSTIYLFVLAANDNITDTTTLRSFKITN
jgi:hypothetical protein